MTLEEISTLEQAQQRARDIEVIKSRCDAVTLAYVEELQAHIKRLETALEIAMTH